MPVEFDRGPKHCPDPFVGCSARAHECDIETDHSNRREEFSLQVVELNDVGGQTELRVEAAYCIEKPTLGELSLMHGKEPDPAAARALDTYWVTVLDHGMNASTFTARVIASTRSDLVSAITGALGALKGPLHGGAPGPVLDMLQEIKSADRAEAWLKNELAQGRRIMGFGHRVYKVRDPRAEVLSKTAERLGQAQLENRQLYELALQVEQTALRLLGEAKPGRNLRTNVEFYTALVLQALGLDPRQFVAMFACGRTAGWCAHVIEQHAEDHLIRPQSEYIGPMGLKVSP